MSSFYFYLAFLLVISQSTLAVFPFAAYYGGHPFDHFGMSAPFLSYDYEGYPYGIAYPYGGYYHPRRITHNTARSFHRGRPICLPLWAKPCIYFASNVVPLEDGHLLSSNIVSPFAKTRKN